MRRRSIIPTTVLRLAQTESEQQARLDLLRRSGPIAFVLAALTGLASTVLPDPDPSDHLALTIIAGALLLNAAALRALGRTPGAIVFFGITMGVLATSATVAVARPLAMTPIYYIYPTLTSAYFLTARWSLLHLLLILVTFAAAMPFAEVEGRLMVFLMTAPVLCVVSLLTRLMAERADALRDELRAVASTDGLTGLLNRRAFTTAFGREAARSERTGLPLSLVLFDLDHFKLVNDRFGHAAGDEALRRFAALVREELLPGDLAARLGGEEFTVALLDCDEAGARRWASRVGERLQAVTATERVALTVSAGVAQRAPGQLELDAVLLGADRALYAAKRAGRRRVVVLSDPRVGPLAGAA